MSVFYRHFHLGHPIREAVKELGLRTLHVKQGKTGVLDYVFERYLAEAEPQGISFIDWVQSDAYDPKAIKADFKESWWGTMLVDRLLRREWPGSGGLVDSADGEHGDPENHEHRHGDQGLMHGEPPPMEAAYRRRVTPARWSGDSMTTLRPGGTTLSAGSRRSTGPAAFGRG